MKKNTASQVVLAQLISKTDGSDVTSGTTTVSVTGDAGTRATGSVGAGAATHEGGGLWSYAPSQAETNYDNVCFQFANASAVTANIQIYTSFPQTGDNFARLGAPAGASVSADVAAIKAETATVLSDTNDIQTRIPAALVSGRIDASVGAMAAGVVTAAAIATDAIDADAIAADAVTEIQSGLATAANLATVAGYLDTEIASILADTNELQTAWANGGRLDLILDARASQTSVDDLPTNAELATALDPLPTAAENADAVWDELIAGHTGVGSTGAALSAAGSAGDPWSTALPGAYGSGTAGNIIGNRLDAAVSSRAVAGDAMALTGGERTTLAGVIWATVIEGSRTAIQYMRGFGSALLGKASGMATTTAVFRDVDDSKPRITATVDADGNRTAVTLDLT